MRPTSREAYARLMVLKYIVVHAGTTPPKPILNPLLEKWPEARRKDFDSKFKRLAEANAAAMRRLRLWKHVSPDERSFLQSFGSRMDEYAQIAAGWRMECAGMIMWALRLFNTWPKIDAQFDPDLLKDVPIQKVGLFSRHPKLRRHEEISAKRDLMEFWHWRVRTRQLIEQDHPFEPDDKMKMAGLNKLDDIVRFSAKAAHEKGDLPEILDEDCVFLGRPFRSLTAEQYQNATSIIMERHYALNWLCGMAPGNRWDETPTET